MPVAFARWEALFIPSLLTSVCVCVCVYDAAVAGSEDVDWMEPGEFEMDRRWWFCWIELD